MNMPNHFSPHDQFEPNKSPPLPSPDPLKVTNQVEYYLSPRNLPYDRLLNANLLPDLYISLYLITNFPRMRALNATNPFTVGRILRKHSHYVIVDSTLTRVRPNWPYVPNPVLWGRKPSSILPVPIPSPPPPPPLQLPPALPPAPFLPLYTYPNTPTTPTMPTLFPLLPLQHNPALQALPASIAPFVSPVHSLPPPQCPIHVPEYHYPHPHHLNPYLPHSDPPFPHHGHPSPPYNRRQAGHHARRQHKQGNVDRRPYRRYHQPRDPAHNAATHGTVPADAHQIREQQSVNTDKPDHQKGNHATQTPAGTAAMMEGDGTPVVGEEELRHEQGKGGNQSTAGTPAMMGDESAPSGGGEGEGRINGNEGNKMEPVQEKDWNGLKGKEEFPMLPGSDVSKGNGDVGAVEKQSPAELGKGDESEGLERSGWNESAAVWANAPRTVFTPGSEVPGGNTTMAKE